MLQQPENADGANYCTLTFHTGGTTAFEKCVISRLVPTQAKPLPPLTKLRPQHHRQSITPLCQVNSQSIYQSASKLYYDIIITSCQLPTMSHKIDQVSLPLSCLHGACAMQPIRWQYVDHMTRHGRLKSEGHVNFWHHVTYSLKHIIYLSLSNLMYSHSIFEILSQS